MAIGFYDYDIYLKPNKLLFNLEAMKIANYYHKLGESVILVNKVTDCPLYEKFYVFRNVLEKQTVRKPAETLCDPNATHLGLAYTGGIYIPMEEQFETQTPHISIYAPYLKQKALDKEITISQVEKLLNSHFIRLRAGTHELDLTKLKRKEKLFIYDYEIEKITDWENKLIFARKELMPPSRILRVQVVNGFKFSSFENVKKLSQIPGFASIDVHLFSTDSYKGFKENFDSIAEWVSSRDGIKYHFGHDINPVNNNEVVKNLCLSINKYFYAKSIGKACEFIVDDKCEVSPLFKFQKDFQYWTGVRVGDQTLKEYYMDRSKKLYDTYYQIVIKTPYRQLFDSVTNKTKNEVREAGWFYHV